MGIIAGEGQFAQPEQRLGFGHLLAGSGREFPRALKRGAGRAELAGLQPGAPEPAQDIRLPGRITELADDGQRLVERGDGAGRLAHGQAGVPDGPWLPSGDAAIGHPG